MAAYDVVVVGGGPAGLTAGLYAARAGAKTLILEQTAPGGQMLATDKIHNYPGILETTGAALAETMQAQAEREGAEVAVATVLGLTANEGAAAAAAAAPIAPADPDASLWRVATDEGPIEARAVILATGTRPRPLGLPQEAELTGHGISYCVTCDAPLFKGRTVAVYGGGNSALYSALELAKLCTKVYLIYHAQTLRGDQVLQARLRERANVEILLDKEVAGLESEQGELTGLRLKSAAATEEADAPGKTAATAATPTSTTEAAAATTLPLAALFVAIGREVETERFAVEKNAAGQVVVDDLLRTSLPRVYAAGDIVEKPLDQIVTAAADGALAATTACRDLSLKK